VAHSMRAGHFVQNDRLTVWISLIINCIFNRRMHALSGLIDCLGNITSGWFLSLSRCITFETLSHRLRKALRRLGKLDDIRQSHNQGLPIALTQVEANQGVGYTQGDKMLKRRHAGDNRPEW
jgi:hypothetical protein